MQTVGCGGGFLFLNGLIVPRLSEAAEMQGSGAGCMGRGEPLLRADKGPRLILSPCGVLRSPSPQVWSVHTGEETMHF